jgi:hypothetical protein
MFCYMDIGLIFIRAAIDKNNLKYQSKNLMNLIKLQLN